MKIVDDLLTFDDVCIKPLISIIDSRYCEKISTKTKFSRNVEIDIPLVSANMDTVTDAEMINEIDRLGGIGVLHRNWGCIQSWVEEIDKITAQKWAICVGKNNWFDILNEIFIDTKNRKPVDGILRCPKVLVYDVAHAGNINIVNDVKALIEFRDQMGFIVDIVVGNIATAEEAKLWKTIPIDGIKVGISNGHACTTQIMTGVGYPQLSSIIEVSRVLKNSGITIIADGGIKQPRDMCKALAAGANCVMIGHTFAWAKEAANKWVDNEKILFDIKDRTGLRHKVWKKFYRGMASFSKNRTKEGVKQELNWIEGVDGNELPTLEQIIKPFIGGLRSCFSYTNSLNIKHLQENVEFVKQTINTHIESNSRINKPIIE